MEASNKKILLVITYYSVLVLAFAASVLFMIAMSMRGVAMYQQIVYYIWAILVIATLVLDLIASNMNSLKFVVGLIIISLAFLCLVMGIIVYAGMSVNGIVPYYAMGRFGLVVGFSVLITVLTIIAYCVGECLVNLNVERRK